MKKISLNPGDKFNRWTVINVLPPYKYPNGRERKKYICRCDCGTIRRVDMVSLTRNHSKSCGCLELEEFKKRFTKHGMNGTQEYKCWQNMKNRCYNQKVKQYKDYGGRGITVCERWLNSFENFYADMGVLPSVKHTIERRDNDKGYSPDNCYWATRTEQAQNNRRNVLISFNGDTRNVTEWSHQTGIKAATIRARITVLNWPPEKALTTPVLGS